MTQPSMHATRASSQESARVRVHSSSQHRDDKIQQNLHTQYRFSTLHVIAALSVALAITVIASIAFGARSVSVDEIVTALRMAPSEDLSVLAIRERFPRTIIAALAGAALAVSGALMQAITRNPIADPGILGINMGASFAVLIGMTYFGTSTLPVIMTVAFAGACVTALIVHTVATTAGGSSPISLALAGMAISAILSSLTSAILLPNLNGMDAFRQWQVGSVGRGSWESVHTLTPIVLLCLLGSLLLSRSLDSLALGDEAATGLGVNVMRTRGLAAFFGVALCAGVTAVAGPIAFLGLMVPHLVRLLLGPSQVRLLPVSALAGAVILLGADVIGRVIMAPSEVPVAVITAIIGAPALIAVTRSSKVAGL